MNVVMVAWLMAAMPATTFAQAAIAGEVKDPSGASLPGVLVEAARPASIETFRATRTDGYALDLGQILEVTFVTGGALDESDTRSLVMNTVPRFVSEGVGVFGTYMRVPQTLTRRRGFLAPDLYDVGPEKAGPVMTLVANTGSYGRWNQYFDGLDLTVNVRRGLGVMLVGGLHISQTAANKFPAEIDV